MSVPEDDGRPDHGRLADENAKVAARGLRDGAKPELVQAAVGIAQVQAQLELAHQVARVAAALERTARG